MPIHPEDLRKGSLRWLLEFEWGGQTYRFAELAGLDTSALEGAPRFTGGLAVPGGVRDSIDYTATRPVSRSARITMSFAGLVDVPRRIARGHDLLGTTGKLYRWVEGTTALELVVSGRTVGPSYGTDHQVALTLQEAAWTEDTALLPPAVARVDDSTWTFPGAVIDDAVESERYPIVFGSPGLAGVHVTPMLFVDTNAPAQGLIAWGEVAATQVDVQNEEDGTNGTFDVVTGTDDAGTIVSTIDMSNAAAGGPLTRTAGDEYRVDWTGGTGGGGIMDSEGNQITGGGQLLRWWLEQSEVRWDSGALAAVESVLDTFQISGFAMASPGSRITPWDWIVKELLPVLPVGVRNGGEGLGFALFQPDGAVEDAVIELESGRNITPTGDDVGYGPSKGLANEFRLNYQMKADGKPNAVAVLTGSDATAVEDSSAAMDSLCRRSQALFGARVWEGSTAHVYEEATAWRILFWRARLQAIPPRVFTYIASKDLSWLRPGDLVALVDSEQAFDTAVTALVGPRVIGVDETFELTLMVYDKRGELRS